MNMTTTTAWNIRNDIDNAETQAEMDEAVARSVESLAEDLLSGLAAVTGSARSNPYADGPPTSDLVARVLAETLESLGAGVGRTAE
jgi:hypothetical protein